MSLLPRIVSAFPPETLHGEKETPGLNEFARQPPITQKSPGSSLPPFPLGQVPTILRLLLQGVRENKKSSEQDDRLTTSHHLESQTRPNFPLISSPAVPPFRLSRIQGDIFSNSQTPSVSGHRLYSLTKPSPCPSIAPNYPQFGG